MPPEPDPAPAPVPKPARLDELDRFVFLGFQGRRQAAELSLLLARDRIAADERAWLAGLEARHNLPGGSVGTGYLIDTESWDLIPASAPAPAQPAPEPDPPAGPAADPAGREGESDPP